MYRAASRSSGTCARNCPAGPAIGDLAPAPDHAIARGRAGAGLLAHIVVSKFDDHLPLYRQAEIFARGGVSLETSPCRAGSGRRRRR
jgi:transposase